MEDEDIIQKNYFRWKSITDNQQQYNLLAYYANRKYWPLEHKSKCLYVNDDIFPALWPIFKAVEKYYTYMSSDKVPTHFMNPPHRQVQGVHGPISIQPYDLVVAIAKKLLELPEDTRGDTDVIIGTRIQTFTDNVRKHLYKRKKSSI